MRLFVAAAAIVIAQTVLMAPPAQGHWADLAVAEITIDAARTEIALVLPTALLRGIDDGDGRLTAAEVAAHRADLEALLHERVPVTGDGTPGTLRVEPLATPPAQAAALAPQTHSGLRLIYVWPSPVARVAVHYGLFAPGVTTASCLATVLAGGRTRTVVFTPEQSDLVISLSGVAVWRQVGSFVSMGIEHILTGYDHLLFLLTLIMLGGSLRVLAKITSAFTVAHSITLSLAVFSVVTLPARWVESAIALSIVYVAVENLRGRERAMRDRWLVTFAFGLVHGLGFASMLKQLAIPRGDLALGLLGFNIGVEIGQIAAVTVAAGFLWAVRTWPHAISARRLASAAAGAAGLIWFLQRAVLS